MARQPAAGGGPGTDRGSEGKVFVLSTADVTQIQGVIALENSFNRVGLDHVVLVKVASTAVVAQMLGLSRDEIINAVSLAWVDGQSLRTYRHTPNTGSRKSWAAGDATSRAVRRVWVSASVGSRVATA